MTREETARFGLQLAEAERIRAALAQETASAVCESGGVPAIRFEKDTGSLHASAIK